jgi:hypothetical protein
LRFIIDLFLEFFTGKGVKKPGPPPMGSVWKWSILEQDWIPVVDPDRDQLRPRH